MKFSIVGALVLGGLLTGCASWQGQVAYPNTRFAALPKYEPAAIPKDDQGNVSLGLAASSMATKPGAGAFIPVLGQVVVESTNLNMMLTSRKTFNWQDPPKFVTVSPAFTTGAWEGAVSGVLSEGSAEISNSVGVKLSDGNNKGIPIPLGGGKAITLKVGVDASLKLTKVRVARLNLANMEYVQALAGVSSDKEAYFVGEVLICDVNSSNLVGFDLEYAPVGSTSNPTLKADYDANYSGVGLVLGASFNKLTSAGRVSFKELGLPVRANSTDILRAIDAPLPQLQVKINKVKNNFRSLGVNKPEIILSSPFTTIQDSEGNVVLSPINPFIGGTESLVVDKTKYENGKATLSDVGEHQVQYSVVSGNKLYALRTTVVLKNGTGGKSVEETVMNRDVSYLRWEAVNPGSVK